MRTRYVLGIHITQISIDFRSVPVPNTSMSRYINKIGQNGSMKECNKISGITRDWRNKSGIPTLHTLSGDTVRKTSENQTQMSENET